MITWKDLLKRSHVPYSGKPGACVVRGASGSCYPGVRIENISYPLTVDALQAALFACLSEKDTPANILLPASAHTDDSVSQVIRNWWKRLYNISEEFIVNAEENLPEPIAAYDLDYSDIGFQTLEALIADCIAPYSAFPVTALVKTDKGVFSGVNIEVPDWQKGLCAERIAMAKACSSGASEFMEIHIHAPGSDYASPCGACRQFMSELMPLGRVAMHHNKYELTRFSVQELLPYQFRAASLGDKR